MLAKARQEMNSRERLLIGITKLDKRWIYKDRVITYQYAIVVAVTHYLSLMETAPSFASQVVVEDPYSCLKYITTQSDDFICRLGYTASFREALGFSSDLLIIPLTIDAGTGAFCRTGGILFATHGNNIRQKAITSYLPLQEDKLIGFAVYEFCMTFENCATLILVKLFLLFYSQISH